MKPRTRSRLASLVFYVPFGFRMYKLFKGTGAALAGLRREYRRSGIDRRSVDPDPLKQFGLWMDEAIRADVVEPNAMTLATRGTDGAPSSRTVLLKGFDERGFVFYTNYESRKARELEGNASASLLFAWLPLERQVELRGTVEKLSREEVCDYFYTRPISSQLGAWASKQSSVIASRDELERRIESLMAQYRGKTIPVPDFWGGFRLKPYSYEFWQGRPSRLHDRLLYSRNGDDWTISRLSP